MEEIFQEIEVIQAIFCGKDEVIIEKQGKESVILSITLYVPQSSEALTVAFVLQNNYPSEIPQISIKSPHLTRRECNKIKLMLEEQCSLLKGEKMLFPVLSTLEEYMQKYTHERVNEDHHKKQENETVYTSLLHLDHMRNRPSYSRTVCQWAKELSLVGRLIFCKKHIFVLLQGSKENLKKYVHLNRTQSVDVDSRGRPCKERLLSVLIEGATSYPRNYSDFCIYDDLPSMEDLKAKLEGDGFGPLAQECKSLMRN